MKTEEILLLVSCILAIIIIIITFYDSTYISKEKFTTKTKLNSYELNLIKMIKKGKATDEELKDYITDNASNFSKESFEKLKAHVKETFKTKK